MFHNIPYANYGFAAMPRASLLRAYLCRSERSSGTAVAVADYSAWGYATGIP